MRESVTYRAIVAEGLAEGRAKGKLEGRVAGERQALLRIGRQRFGTPSPAVLSILSAITTPETLERMMDNLLRAQKWEELLTQ